MADSANDHALDSTQAHAPSRQRAISFLSAPYSHHDPTVRLYRFQQANRAAAQLMRCGHVVFSPISMGHPISEDGGVPRDARFWGIFLRAFMEASRELIVLRLDGWRESVGVTAELAIAAELGIPVSYIDATPSAATEAA